MIRCNHAKNCSIDRRLMSSFRKPWAVILLLTAIAYENSFTNPFCFDDSESVHNNPSIRSWWPIWQPFCPPASGGPVTGRPVVNLTFALNYAVSGEAPWSYHVVNLLIHLGGSLLLFSIVRRTLLLPSMPERWSAAATGLAFAVALLWTLHPLQTESVTYVSQRAESLVGFFYLLTLYCFLRAATADSTVADRSAHTAVRAWSVATVAACLAGMASKEVMVSAPLLILFYDRAFVAGTVRQALRRRGWLYAALAATWLLLGWLVIAANDRGGSAGLGLSLSPWTYACTQFGAIVHYLRLSVWPYPLAFDYGMGVAQGAAEIVPYAILVAILVAAALWAFWRWPKVGFLGAWFFAILAPTSSVVPIATQTMAEHRMYLPLAAVIVLLVAAAQLVAWRAVQRRQISAKAAKWLGYLGLASIAIIFAVLVHDRNTTYRSTFALWKDTVEKVPTSARAHNNYAMMLHKRGQTEAAIAEYRRAAELKKDFVDPHYNLGLTLNELGRWKESEAEFRKALEIQPDHAGSRNCLGAVLVDLGRVDEGIREYEKVLRQKPDMAEVHYNLANALAIQKRFPEAVEHYQRAIDLKPTFTDALCDFAILLATCDQASVRDGPKAVSLAERAVQLSTSADASMLDALAAAYAEAGRFPEAIRTAQRALQWAGPGNEKLTALISSKLRLYEAHRPFHTSQPVR